MPFFVAVFRDVRPEHLDDVLTTIRGDLAASRRLHPGRRDARVFQRLNYPTQLLELAEWDSQAEYEQLPLAARRQSQNPEADPPTRIENLLRLRLFARMSAPANVVGCVMMTAPAENAEVVHQMMLHEMPHGIQAPSGLVTHELYRMGADERRLLVVHSWRTIDDLERFRTSNQERYDTAARRYGMTTERFTGVVAAELSRFEI